MKVHYDHARGRAIVPSYRGNGHRSERALRDKKVQQSVFYRFEKEKTEAERMPFAPKPVIDNSPLKGRISFSVRYTRWWS